MKNAFQPTPLTTRAQGPAQSQTQGPGPSQGQGQPGQGQQSQGQTQPGHAQQPAPETCMQDPGLVTSPVTYSQADLAGLAYMIEEEKLAGDIYDALYQQTGLQVFDRIGDSEDQHLSTLLQQAQIAGLNLDHILALPEGQYSNPELQTLYDTLLASGSVSVTAALEVGVAIEQTDIADLQLALADLVGTPLGTAYANLSSGSANHLAAFEGWLA